MKINLASARRRAERLRQLIDNYRYHYHVLDESIMSEAAADSLKHELAEIEAQFPELITADSPTQRVAGSVLPGFTQVQHTTRMLSLNDVFSRDEVAKWIDRIQKLVPEVQLKFFADLKLDGLACSLIYEDGVLLRALTRGDGLVGEDVTMNVRTIESVPFHLRHDKRMARFLKGRTEIRGEIVIYKHDFAALNKQRQADGLPIFANPRNLAAGSIRQLDPKLAGARPLRFRAWDILRDQANEVPSYAYAYEVLRTLGLAASQEATQLSGLDDVMKFVNKWQDRRYKLPYNTDGVVIKLNDKEAYQQLGVVGKAPRAAAAYKYAAEEATTIVRDIVLSIGRTGAATPVAVLDPVHVAGTTVQHASLHNADEIDRKDIRVGDTVIIFKAGDIIPQVLKVLTELRPKSAKEFDMERELKRQYPELSFVRPEGEAVYRLKDATGKLLLKQALVHFASKAAMDIDTLGEKNVESLVDSGLVHDVADIYILKKEDVLNLERFAEISAHNLIEAITATKTPELPRFIYGLGIRHVGVQTAIDLAEQFGELDKLEKATLDQLLQIEGIGSIVAEAILAWLADLDNHKLLVKFARYGVRPQYHSRARGPLHGQSFVITGTFESMSRDQVVDRIRQLGGTFQTSVAKDTSYLVVGRDFGASKLKKAEELGTKQINEAELMLILKK